MRQRGFALVVEGYMDVVALAQLGFPNAVATLGTACTAEHVQKLFRFTDSVVSASTATPPDARRPVAPSGGRAAARHRHATHALPVPPPEHDPDSVRPRASPPAFERMVARPCRCPANWSNRRADCDLSSAEAAARLLANARPLGGCPTAP